MFAGIRQDAEARKYDRARGLLVVAARDGATGAFAAIATKAFGLIG